MSYVKKVTRIIPCVLVLSILAYIPLTVYAYQGRANYRFQGKGDERLEQIMDLVEKARIRASISLQLSQNLGFDISRLQEKYRLGLQLMDNASLEYRNGKYVEALNYAFQAMNAFRECIRNATKTIAEDRANVSIGWMGLTVAVDRLEEFVERVNSSVQAVKAE
ncbi:MAG: hypothetical protein N3E44_04925, partial [Candidatus Bathyarchaeota archaeon]|nr:hypothetical protein [Candidatus Bathyarchaeota archaeon]